jgi:hypothetical protein
MMLPAAPFAFRTELDPALPGKYLIEIEIEIAIGIESCIAFCRLPGGGGEDRLLFAARTVRG